MATTKTKTTKATTNETALAPIPTGFPGLDEALGADGLPRGVIVEVFGKPNTGKTTIAWEMMAAAQRAGFCVHYVDCPHMAGALFARRATNPTVDAAKLTVSQPEDRGVALKIVETMARSGVAELVVVDGLAPPDDDNEMFLWSRYMSTKLRTLAATVNRTGVTVVFVTTLAEKFGVPVSSFDHPRGASALKFYSSVRLDVRRQANMAAVRVVKNKLAAPFREATIRVAPEAT